MRQKGKFLMGWLVLVWVLVACGGQETAVSTTSATAEQTSPTTAASQAATVTAPEATTAPERLPAERYADLEIVTLLPRDAIPAIDDPEFLTAEEANGFYDPDELIIGVEFNGEARAYSVPFLSNHEIVNDEVGGEKIAVTW
ncbi:MAG: hypothetical protein Kow0080_13580 [Candidatus Promineifilaceae bacterium]